MWSTKLQNSPNSQLLTTQILKPDMGSPIDGPYSPTTTFHPYYLSNDLENHINIRLYIEVYNELLSFTCLLIHNPGSPLSLLTRTYPHLVQSMHCLLTVISCPAFLYDFPCMLFVSADCTLLFFPK